MSARTTRLLLGVFLCSLFSSVCADTAMQNLDAYPAINLDGRWDVIVDPYESGFYNHRYEESESGYFKNAKPQNAADLVEYDFSRSQKLSVPGDWNTQDDKFFLYEGTMWYHRDFDVGKKADLNYFVYFGAINYQATVYLNGKKIDAHEGGFTPFQFNISSAVKPGLNSLVVKVDNRRERDQIPTVNTDWWNYGGITRSVKIIMTPKAYINDYFVQLAKDEDVIEGTVKVDSLEKLADGQKVELRIPELNIDYKIPLNKNGEGKFSIPSKPQLWSPELPRLYKVDLIYNNQTVHDLIGFRRIQTQGESLLLNGNSIFLRGISIHEESPLHEGRAYTEEDARILLTWAKELGCNFVRLAHYPHNDAMVKVADQMGLMVWSEIPVYWTVLFNNPAVYEKAENQLQEMIDRDKNRASIILWSVANETPNTSARTKFLSNLIQKARQMDSTRLVTAALDTQSDTEGLKSIDDPLANLVDVIGINSYCGWYVAAPGACPKWKWTSRYHKPMIMSEFGGDALQGLHGDKGQRWTEEYQADVYVNNLSMLESISFLRGTSPWVLRDFRSPRRHLPNVQDFWNRKGLISDKGVKKKAWSVLHDYYLKKTEQYERPLKN